MYDVSIKSIDQNTCLHRQSTFLHIGEEAKMFSHSPRRRLCLWDPHMMRRIFMCHKFAPPSLLLSNIGCCAYYYVTWLHRLMILVIPDPSTYMRWGRAARLVYPVMQNMCGKHHGMDWEAVEVLFLSTDWCRRCVIESRHIQCEPAAMNRDQGTMPPVYKTLQWHNLFFLLTFPLNSFPNPHFPLPSSFLAFDKFSFFCPTLYITYITCMVTFWDFISWWKLLQRTQNVWKTTMSLLAM